MLKLFDKLLSFGGVLNGYKTLVGAALMFGSELAVHIPALAVPFAHGIDVLNQASEVLVALGLVHWKVKDLIK